MTKIIQSYQKACQCLWRKERKLILEAEQKQEKLGTSQLTAIFISFLPNLWRTFKVNGYTFKGDNSVKMGCLLSEKSSSLKGKNLLPLGANSFLLEKRSFQKGFVCRKVNSKSQKLPPLQKLAGNLPNVWSPLQNEVMMIWCFILSTLYKSYWDDGRMIIKGSVQWTSYSHTLQSISSQIKTLTSWSKVGSANHLATWMLPQQRSRFTLQSSMIYEHKKVLIWGKQILCCWNGVLLKRKEKLSY